MNDFKTKAVVVDTSVLLYDPQSLYNFGENDIYLPFIVLEEIDKKKSSPGVLGENARTINRLLDELRIFGKLHKGVEFNKVTLTVYKDTNDDLLKYLGSQSNDNVILANCEALKDKNTYERIKLITKDINLRVKADSLDILAADYYGNYENLDTYWTGWSNHPVTKQQIDEFYSEKKLKVDTNYSPNEFIVMISESSSALGQFKGGYIYPVATKDECKNETGSIPKNKEQQFALSMLTDDSIPLVTMTGLPGSGKTYLSFMAGIKLVGDGAYERIIYTRPITTVGASLGFLPGDIEEKWAPYLAPIEDNFRNAFGDLSYFSLMRQKGQIDIAPISYMRGRSFKNCYIIVDEAQNCSPHELKTIITRMADGSKLLLLGDIKQIDNVYMNERSNGLSIVTGKFKHSHLSGHIEFTKGYRSELATEGDKLLE
jgi:PhoH-like ATPase